MKLLLPLILLLLATPGLAFTGQVVKITDGDTIQVIHHDRAEKVRLADIDCPERGQPFGTKAKRFVVDLAAGKVVEVEVRTTDRYGRTVGEVFLPDGRSLNRELVKAGLAWWYRQYSKDVSLGKLETAARKAKRGLWVDPAPIAPWEWRRNKTETKKPRPEDRGFKRPSKYPPEYPLGRSR